MAVLTNSESAISQHTSAPRATFRAEGTCSPRRAIGIEWVAIGLLIVLVTWELATSAYPNHFTGRFDARTAGVTIAVERACEGGNARKSQKDGENNASGAESPGRGVAPGPFSPPRAAADVGVTPVANKHHSRPIFSPPRTSNSRQVPAAALPVKLLQNLHNFDAPLARSYVNTP